MPEDTSTERRRLLQLAAATAGALWLPRSAWSQPRFNGNPFGLGVASGSPTHDSVVLWTRLVAPGWFQSLGTSPITVRWEIAHDEAFQRIVQRGQSQAVHELAHSVHVEASGLEPDRWYFYRFMSAGAVSTTGRTRTFPAPDADPQRLRVAYASCQRWEHGYYGAYRHMRDEDLDAVLFLGDYIYEYPISGSPVRVHAGGWAVSLDDYRERHALHKGDADLQAMHAACPWITTWDDHEVQNDYAGLTAGQNGPVVDDFAARRAAAYQAYYEHMPVRATFLAAAVSPGASAVRESRLYSQQRFGRLANLVLLDTRQYRDPQVCGRAGKGGSSLVDPAACATWQDPARTLLGDAQERWLDNVFSQSCAGWTVVAQQSLFGRRDGRPGTGELLWNDSWDGYGAARGRLTNSLQRHQVANPVILGGDVHENWVGHVKADYNRPDSEVIGVEFCGTSITSRAGSQKKVAERLAENPHFVFAEGRRRGYGVAEFTPKQLTTRLRVVDDVASRNNKIETLATFVVQPGRAQVETA
jgi:alkaline phosphatase D